MSAPNNEITTDDIRKLMPNWFWQGYLMFHCISTVGVVIWSVVWVLRAPSIWAGLTDPVLWWVNGIVWAANCVVFLGMLWYVFKNVSSIES
jgi:hypothetical protein